MPYLFQISIGPVQTFIQDARRTRDLAFNSSFLSELARVAAQKIKDQGNAASLIFPADNVTDVPNKILAYIELSPSNLAVVVKSAMDMRVHKYWEYAVKHIRQPFEQEVAKLQIDDLVEFTWVAVPFDRATGSYWLARRKLEALLAARKNTRDFRQVILEPNGWGSDKPKSSINGQLESVIPQNAYPLNWNRVERAAGEERENLKKEYWKKAETLRKQFGAGPHEKLSGVDLLKRLGPITLLDKPVAGEEGAGDASKGEKSFPSTSHMAALPFLQALHKIAERDWQLVEAWRSQYISALKEVEIKKAIPFQPDILPQDFQENSYWPDSYSLGIYDGALLYPERFPDVVGDAQAYQEAREQFQKAARLLDNFCQTIGFFPTPYYTLLVADGDSMGKVIDGQARVGMEQHQSLSKALSAFAGGVRKTVQRHAGVCLYAGGDDVLALLPMHKAVGCASELAESFQKALDTFREKGGRSPTLSVGLAVVHHLHPLWDALNIARAAERRAKSGGKDALAITVQKRGGPPGEIGGRWDIFEPRLRRLMELYQNEVIPSGMAYELAEIALRLEPKAERARDQELSSPHVQYAALRVFQRKLSERSRERRSEQEIAATLRDLKGMIGLEQYQPVRVGQLAQELVVAQLFAQAQMLANGRKGAQE